MSRYPLHCAYAALIGPSRPFLCLFSHSSLLPVPLLCFPPNRLLSKLAQHDVHSYTALQKTRTQPATGPKNEAEEREFERKDSQNQIMTGFDSIEMELTSWLQLF